MSYIIPFGPINGVDKVLLHALERAEHRFKITGTFGERLSQLEKVFAQAKKIKLPSAVAVTKLLNNNFESAQYFSIGKPWKLESFIFVVVDNKIKTVYTGSEQYKGSTFVVESQK